MGGVPGRVITYFNHQGMAASEDTYKAQLEPAAASNDRSDLELR